MRYLYTSGQSKDQAVRERAQDDPDLPGTTPALRLGPGTAGEAACLLLDDEPFAVEPNGLLGADGPVAVALGEVALGRDMSRSFGAGPPPDVNSRSVLGCRLEEASCGGLRR